MFDLDINDLSVRQLNMASLNISKLDVDDLTANISLHLVNNLRSELIVITVFISLISASIFY